MRFLLAAAITAALVSPAFAQDHVPKYGEEEKAKTDAQKAADKAAADAYKRSLSAIPDQGPTDPWGTVRSDGPKTAATKTTKAKTGPKSAAKTGSPDAKAQ